MVEEIFSFEPYGDLIDTVSADPRRRDPHFAYDGQNLYGALKSGGQRAYVTKAEGEATGLYVWSVLPEDRYIEMIVGLTKEADSVEEMLSFIEAEHPGYRYDFVINPQHERFAEALTRRGAVFDEEQQWMICEKGAAGATEKEIRLLSPEYTKQYLSLHTRDVYWTAERVLGAGDRFRVFLALEDGRVVGYLDVTCCFDKNEIYDLRVGEAHQGKGYEAALLREAIRVNSPKPLTVLVDADQTGETAVYRSVGFVPVGGTRSVYATYQR